MWIKVADQLPEPKRRVIFASAKQGVCVGFKEDKNPDSHWWGNELELNQNSDPDDVWDVTHWQPLPEPPTE